MNSDFPNLDEHFAQLNRMREELGESRMQHVADIDLRNAMIHEYKLMATTSLQLLTLLEQSGVLSHMSASDQQHYQAILQQLAGCSSRCTEFVAQSEALDAEALLASLPLQHERAN